MSKLLSRTSILAIGLAVAGVSHAAMFQNQCRPGNVTVPCAASAWGVGLEAMWLEATSGTNWDYGQYYQYQGYAYDTIYERRNFSPDHDLAWRLEASYYFNTGNDATVIWTHFRDDSAASGESSRSTEYNLTSHYFHALAFDEINARLDNKFDSLDLEFGQLAHYGHGYNVRTHYGFQWARIENGIDATVLLDENSLDLTSSAAVYSNDSEFSGIGVRAGLDTSYELGSGFSLEGKAAAGILVGELESSTTLFTPGFITEGPTTLPALNNLWSTERHAIVPELDAVAAVRYTKQFSNSELSVSLGWRIMNYFDAIDTTFETVSIDEQSTIHPYQGKGEQTEMREKTDNFALNGPVVGIRWIG